MLFAMDRKCLDCVQPSTTASRPSILSLFFPIYPFASSKFALLFPFSFFFFFSFFSTRSISFESLICTNIYIYIFRLDYGWKTRRTVVTKVIDRVLCRLEASETAVVRTYLRIKAGRWNLHIILMQFAIRIASLGCELYSVCGGWMGRFN